ncbi:MAG: type II toxin-antitoxin system VapC family toxin [Planctomycetota bacterium]|nr:type II toxin-antitoxin system VapC family toxin [Planctomycetota bacterium]
MHLLDVNVLVYAYRADAPRHDVYRVWLERLVNGDESFAVADLVFSGFLRVVTHPKVFNPPSPLDKALAFVNILRARPNFVALAPGARHWELFVRLCETGQAKGNLVPDAYLAALAIESGCTWVTSDGDFDRFPGLRVLHPLHDS